MTKRMRRPKKMKRAAIQPWSPEEAKRERSTALRLFSQGHDYPHRGIDTDNCAYCALTASSQSQPNYAGWARLYVEANRAMPKKWQSEFEAERNRSDNPAYSNALERDIVTFGEPTFY